MHAKTTLNNYTRSCRKN